MNGQFNRALPTMEIEEILTIPFTSTVDANSEKTLVSKRIAFPFQVHKIIAAFALNTNHTLQLIPYVSRDPSAPSSGKPTGDSLLAPYGQVDYLTGDDEHEEHFNTTTYQEKGLFLKIYANNTDSFEHTIDAQIQIIPLPR